jgi:hypothetical protein
MIVPGGSLVWQAISVRRNCGRSSTGRGERDEQRSRGASSALLICAAITFGEGSS